MSNFMIGVLNIRDGRPPRTASTLSSGHLLCGLALFCLLWTFYLGRASSGVPVDNVEQLTWVRSLEWGYFKHPPLPTWLIWPLVEIRGLHADTSYLMGALVKGCALAGFWWLMVQLRGQGHAAVALMAACCIVYYSRHLHIYNHNVVMFAAVVAAAICSWQAWSLRSLRWWGLLGFALGLGMLTKYQAVVTATCVFVFFSLNGSWRDAVHRRGALLAVAIAAAMFAPHVWWLCENPINPLTYAVESSLGAGLDVPARLLMVIQWVTDHVFNRGLGALLLLVGLAAMAMRSPLVPAVRDDHGPDRDASARLLWVFALIPVAFIALTVLVLGAEARKHWGTAYLIWLVPAVMEAFRRVDWKQLPLAWVLVGFASVQSVLLAEHAISMREEARNPSQARVGQPMAHQWAFEVAQRARFEMGSPIHVVVGPETVASAFALELPERPRVLIDGNTGISPWLPEGVSERCAAVEFAWGAAPAGAQPLTGGPPGLWWRARPPAQDAECPYGPNRFGRKGSDIVAARDAGGRQR